MSGRRRGHQVRHEHRLRAALARAVSAAVVCAAVACSGKVTPPPPEVIELEHRDGPVTIVSVGDVMLGAEGEPSIRKHGYDWPFARVRSLLAGADLVMGNLESTITDESVPSDPDRNIYYNYRMTREAAAALARAGFRTLWLANNHARDYGVRGMLDTIAAARALGMETVGAGVDEAAARRGVVYDLGSVRVGVLSYVQSWRRMVVREQHAKGDRPGVALLEHPFGESLGADIARMRRHADVVIVSVHWGRNYRDVNAAQRRAGRYAIERGADIVNGHHPHILQGIEIYQGKPIIYSLGNFVFTSQGRFDRFGRPGYGLVTRMFFEDRRLAWLAATPIAVDNLKTGYQSRPLSPRRAFAALWPQLVRFGTPARWRGDTAFIGFRAGWQDAPLPSLPWQVP